MALVTIRLADETLLKYAQYDSESPERAIQRQLESNKEHDPGARRLVLSGEKLSALEKSLGLQVEDVDKLLRSLDPLTKMRIDETHISLSEWQRKRLLQAAEFHRKPAGEYLELVTKKALEAALGAS